VLSQLAEGPPWPGKGRLLAHSGEIPPGYDILSAIDDLNELWFCSNAQVKFVVFRIVDWILYSKHCLNTLLAQA
jgi:hypothetical protein